MEWIELLEWLTHLILLVSNLACCKMYISWIKWYAVCVNCYNSYAVTVLCYYSIQVLFKALWVSFSHSNNRPIAIYFSVLLFDTISMDAFVYCVEFLWKRKRKTLKNEWWSSSYHRLPSLPLLRILAVARLINKCQT